MYRTRNGISTDQQAIMSLYRKVAARSGGIARSESEVTPEYIHNFMVHAKSTGFQLVVEDPNDPAKIIAEIHAYKLVPKVFTHVLSELTIAVDPDFQGRGIGKLIFTSFLNHIAASRPDILRVELMTQESNEAALKLYKSVGFVQEGRMQSRIRMHHQRLDADIPMAWFNPNFKEIS